MKTVAIPSSPSSPPRRTVWLAMLAVVLTGLAAYHNSFPGIWFLDDRAAISENLSIRQLWPLRSAFSPPPELGVSGRPLANFTFALNYAISGSDVGSYHALNLALHLLAAWTLFGVIRRTLSGPRLPERFRTHALPLALASTILWTVHPLQTQVVNYVSQRTEVLMGLFYLLTLYCFIRAVNRNETGPSAPGKPTGGPGIVSNEGTETKPHHFSSKTPAWWLGLSVLTCLLGALSKEIIVTAPVLVLLYDRTFVAGTFRAAWSRRRLYYSALAVTWPVVAFLLHGAGNRGTGYGLGVSAFDYLLTECRVVPQYLKLGFWPHPLVFDYGDEIVRRVADVGLPAAVLGIGLASTLLALRRQPTLGFLGAWFFLILSPTSSFVPVANQPMAESRMYLPVAALVLFSVLGLHRLGGRYGLAAWFAVGLAFGALTVQRNEVYRSVESLSLDTLEKRPRNARIHNNLGNFLVRNDRASEAIPYFEAALQINPDYAVAHNGLGNALLKINRPAEGRAHFEKALEIDPGYFPARLSLGSALLALGQAPEAVRCLEEALQLKPDLVEARVELGKALRVGHRFSEAILLLDAVVRDEPTNVHAHLELGIALAQEGRTTEAIKTFEAARSLAPHLPTAHVNLGIAALEARKPSAAVHHFQAALKLKPDDATTHYNLAIALQQTARTLEAIQHCEEAVRLNAQFTAARKFLQRLQALRTQMSDSGSAGPFPSPPAAP